MARKLVVLLDGTGNEIGTNLSNVLKFYMCLEESDDQRVYYDPGVGTIGKPGWWSQLRIRFQAVLGLALGYGLDDNVLGAYSWLCRTWQPGDEIYLLGFSRGAYTARVLGGFIHMCGLLRPDQLDLCGYALVAYKRSADENDLEIGHNFGRIAGARRITIRFIGVWDTVASVLTPRADRFYLPSLQTLPYTRSNPSVAAFRHAISMDERRRMFRLNHWKDPQFFYPEPGNWKVRERQEIRQVWFAGVHSDVGGGYPEDQSSLSKYPLLWMIEQARLRPDPDSDPGGLVFDEAKVDRLARGINAPGAKYDYVAPDPTGPLHRSLTGPWWLLEPLPKYYTLKEWPRRRVLLDFYLPLAEPRPIPNRPWPGRTDPFFIHSSAVARIGSLGAYRPVNLPMNYDIDYTEGPEPPPPPAPASPYRQPNALQRLLARATTWPPLGGWIAVGGLLLGLLIAAWVLDRLDLVPWRSDPGLPPWPLIATFLSFAVAEEAVFRGALLRPPPDGASAFGPAAWSALLFALWQPLFGRLLHGDWQSYMGDAGFMIGAFLLGFVCARLVLSTRSLWPAVALHWLVAIGGMTLYSG
jgi:membrane protease YdiL (CAAX protease family)